MALFLFSFKALRRGCLPVLGSARRRHDHREPHEGSSRVGGQCHRLVERRESCRRVSRGEQSLPLGFVGKRQARRLRQRFLRRLEAAARIVRCGQRQRERRFRVCPGTRRLHRGRRRLESLLCFCGLQLEERHRRQNLGVCRGELLRLREARHRLVDARSRLFLDPPQSHVRLAGLQDLGRPEYPLCSFFSILRCSLGEELFGLRDRLFQLLVAVGPRWAREGAERQKNRDPVLHRSRSILEPGTWGDYSGAWGSDAEG